MIMKKHKKSSKGWDFLNTCTSEQLNLLKEVLFIKNKKGSSIDLTDGEGKRIERKVDKAKIIKALSGEGKYIDYYAYLKHVADILSINNVCGNNFVDYEDAILLTCLREAALKNPKFFKSSYNLAASSSEEVVEELEVRFTTSPALRKSLPVVLSAIYAESLSLSKASKDVIDDRLKVLGVLSSFGTYNIASLATVYAIGTAFGPIGLVAASVYHLGKMLFSSNMPKDNIMPVTCILIMLRRQELDAVSDRYAASDVVSKLMADSISVIGKDVADQKERFLLSFFMEMLKGKDENAYKKVCQLFPKANSCVENMLIKGEKAIIKPLLPYAGYLVERFYPLLFPKQNIEEYIKYVSDITSNNSELKSCLIQGFMPSLVNAYSNIHFYIAASDKAKVSFCLELMGQQYSEYCIDSLSANEKFCVIIAKDKKSQSTFLKHLLPGGECFCFVDEKENVQPLGENVLVKQLKEENNKLMQQLEEYKKKELFWKNATHSFRHSHMTHFINSIRNATYYLKKQYNIEQNVRKIETSLAEMSMYVEQFGKDEICQCDIWELLQDTFKDLEVKGVFVVWKNVCVTQPQSVALFPRLFKEWVLGNILTNIYTHAFPDKIEEKKCIVWITLREQESSFVIEICNNGQTFNGDPGQIFQKGKHFGGTGHTGYGLYYAKVYMRDFLNGNIEMMPFTQEYSIGFKITISK